MLTWLKLRKEYKEYKDLKAFINRPMEHFIIDGVEYVRPVRSSDG